MDDQRPTMTLSSLISTVGGLWHILTEVKQRFPPKRTCPDCNHKPWCTTHLFSELLINSAVFLMPWTRNVLKCGFQLFDPHIFLKFYLSFCAWCDVGGLKASVF